MARARRRGGLLDELAARAARDWRTLAEPTQQHSHCTHTPGPSIEEPASDLDALLGKGLWPDEDRKKLQARASVRQAWEKLRAEQVPTPPEWKDEPSEPLFAEDEHELDLRPDQLLLPLKKHLTEISPGAMERFAALELGEERPYEQRLANKLFALTEDAHDPLYILGQALYRHRPITEEMLKKAISRLSHDDAWSPEVRRLFAGWDLLAEVNDLYNQMFEPERPIVPELELNPCGGHHHRRRGPRG